MNSRHYHRTKISQHHGNNDIDGLEWWSTHTNTHAKSDYFPDFFKSTLQCWIRGAQDIRTMISLQYLGVVSNQLTKFIQNIQIIIKLHNGHHTLATLYSLHSRPLKQWHKLSNYFYWSTAWQMQFWKVWQETRLWNIHCHESS